MNLKIYAIRDRATDQFGNPMFLITNGHAIRSFADEINRDADNNQLNKHSEDFDLYLLGEYETDSGIFTTHSPKQIAIGKDHKVGKA